MLEKLLITNHVEMYPDYCLQNNRNPHMKSGFEMHKTGI